MFGVEGNAQYHKGLREPMAAAVKPGDAQLWRPIDVMDTEHMHVGRGKQDGAFVYAPDDFDDALLEVSNTVCSSAAGHAAKLRSSGKLARQQAGKPGFNAGLQQNLALAAAGGEEERLRQVFDEVCAPTMLVFCFAAFNSFPAAIMIVGGAAARALTDKLSCTTHGWGRRAPLPLCVVQFSAGPHVSTLALPPPLRVLSSSS